MEAAAAVVVFVLMTAFVTAGGYAVYVRPVRLRAHLSDIIGDSTTQLPTVPQTSTRRKPAEWLSRIGKLLPVSPQYAELTGRDLIAAGWRNSAALHVFLGARILLCCVLLFASITLAEPIAGRNTTLRYALFASAAAGGFLLPTFILDKLVARRQRRIRLSLPDALDLLVVCVEAGLGLDQAIVNVSRQLKHAHPDLSEELGLMNAEMRAGKRRADAFRNLAARTGEEDVRKLVAVLIQADRFGTSIADSLRTHSEFMRIRRKQLAEERAAKVGVKLVFPIFFFIMPAMMVVSVGPGVLQLVKNLIPMMRSVK